MQEDSTTPIVDLVTPERVQSAVRDLRRIDATRPIPGSLIFELLRGGGPTVVMQDGAPVAALISLGDLEQLLEGRAN